VCLYTPLQYGHNIQIRNGHTQQLLFLYFVSSAQVTTLSILYMTLQYNNDHVSVSLSSGICFIIYDVMCVLQDGQLYKRCYRMDNCIRDIDTHMPEQMTANRAVTETILQVMSTLPDVYWVEYACQITHNYIIWI
jgi:hypothetical protein